MRRLLRRFLVFFGGILLCAGIAALQGVHTTTLVVTSTADSGTGSLRQALADAIDGDTIQFAATLTGQAITLTSDELVIDKSITITGPGSSQLAVQRDFTTGAPSFRILHITPGHTVMIEGLTIKGGRKFTAPGGGIFNDQATLTLNHCAVVENYTTHFGGGIYNSGGSARLTILNSTVSDNLNDGIALGSGGFGGGINNEGTLKISNSTLSRNMSRHTDGVPRGGSGGAIYNAPAINGLVGILEISNSTISNNIADRHAGGIFAGQMTLTDSTVSGNTTTGLGSQGSLFYGGGIFCGSATIRNSTISGNTAVRSNRGVGGAVAVLGSLTITNSTLSGNRADQGGGGIHNYVDLGGTSATTEIGNTILNAGASGPNLFGNPGTVISRGYNLSSDNGSGFLIATGDQINTDPILGPLQNNGGLTMTHGLLAGSPAINAGNPSFVPPPVYDQRGAGYDRVHNGRIDIGSFELLGNIRTVTSTANSGAGSLRDTIASANDGDTIQFDAALNGQTITLTSAELVIDKNISLSGPGPGLLSVARDSQTAPFRIFRVTPGHSVTIAGLTIANGLAQPPSDKGGGILNDHATLTLNNCALAGHAAGFGGAVYSDGGVPGSATLAINSSTVMGNSASFGAGIFNNAASSGNATLTIKHSTLSGNSASTSGGAVFNEGDNGGTGAVTIDNSTLSGNAAAINGGALLNDGFAGTGTTVITNTTLSDNNAGSSGVAGAVFNQSGSIEVGNTIFDAGQGPNLRSNGGTITSRGYNLSSDDGSGFLNASGDQINANPMLGPLQANGGLTFTHELLLGSPAIDAGDPNFTPPPDFDQRGLGFPRVANSRINIGALEVQPVAPSPTPSPTPTPAPTPRPSPTNTPTPPPCGVTFAENFDGVAAPALPGGWTTSVTGFGMPWETSTSYPDSGPNTAFAPASSNVSNAELITPTIMVPPTGGIVSFQNLFNLQADPPPYTASYDGMVLEISVNGGAYTDIITAGGTFVSGGYNRTIEAAAGSSIAGRMAWSFVSAGTTSAPDYIITTVNLPATTDGQSIRLKWRLATDVNANTGFPAAGVRIDSIFLTPANCPTTPTPTPTPTLTLTPPPTPSPTATASPATAQALNISTRLRVEAGDTVLIAGFIISGNAPKTVAVRGIGPSLSGFGIADALADPTLELRAANGALLLQNDDWQDDPAQAAQLTALGLALQNSRESGLVTTLNPGASYTAILAGKNGGTGVGLVEVYDTNQAADSQLANISTRGFVQTGSNVMIGGFILGGSSAHTQVAVRGIGPSLGQFGLGPVLANPTLELHDGNGALLISSDDWQDDPAQAAQLSAHGLALPNTAESGIFASLPPGAFTAILAGKNGGTGIGLVEIYNVH